MTLTDFLLARITEDQVWAEDLFAPTARWVLAECEAKRRIVAACDYDGMTAEYVLTCLALPYADHPDYDESWRP